MKKSTDDLMKILRSKSSVDEYFDENDSEIFFGSLSELIDFFMAVLLVFGFRIDKDKSISLSENVQLICLFMKFQFSFL